MTSHDNKNIVSIHSDHSANGRTKNNFVVDLGSSSVTNSVKGVHIKSVSFCNCKYNIDKYSNTLWYKTAPLYDTLFSVEIPVGQYNSQALLDAIETELAGAGIVIDWDINPLDYKVEIASCAPVIQLYDYTDGKDCELSQKLGVSGSLILEDLQVFPNVVDISGLTNLFIRSRSLSSHMSLETITKPKETLGGDDLPVLSDIVEVIGVDKAFGSYVHHDSDISENYIEYPVPRNINEVDIRLTDSKNRIIDLNGSKVSIVLEFFH